MTSRTGQNCTLDRLPLSHPTTAKISSILVALDTKPELSHKLSG